MSQNGKYDYSDAGFNGLLSRSKISNPYAQTLMDGPSTGSGMTINFDRQQVAGQFGNVAKIGNIALDGVGGDILLNDGTNDRLLIGRRSGGF